MNCAVHTDVAAKGFCRQCGKAMCESCSRDVRGIPYCEECLAAMVTAPHPPAAGGPSPPLAAVLGVIPGLGAVYNGEYLKAVIHVLVFGTMIALMDRTSAEEFLIPLFIAFLFYMPIEAYRTAKARVEGRTPTSLFGDMPGGQPIGAYVLIGLGMLLLLEQSGLRVFEYVGRFIGPLLLIGLGLYLIRRQMGGAPPSGGPPQ